LRTPPTTATQADPPASATQSGSPLMSMWVAPAASIVCGGPLPAGVAGIGVLAITVDGDPPGGEGTGDVAQLAMIKVDAAIARRRHR
jgi:hypothetical protein